MATDGLDAVLTRARELGFLGPGPIDGQRAHAEAFLGALEGAPSCAFDLGSGGGVPGLVLALALPTTQWLLVDAMTKRTAFLADAVAELGLADRARVLTARAEELVPEHRGVADLVVARGFGPPAVLAECAAPLLAVGGQLVVSEPPGGQPGRWDAEGLAMLGLELEATLPGPPALVRLRLTRACPPRYPRRSGVPRKRPLWT
jgi:16S rRNA (guanine527-N7)-methyltransferase